MSEYSVVSYIPALHKGYVDFFAKYPGVLYILNSDFVRETPRMDRDIRALKPEEAKAAVEGLKFFSHIQILTPQNLEELRTRPQQVVMPDEDVSRQFAQAYLADKAVTFVSTFLRWDKLISTAELAVPPDRTISELQFDQEVMKSALAEAQKSADWWRQIGAVIVKDSLSVLTAHNSALPSEEYGVNVFGDPRSNFDAGKNIELVKTIHAEARLIAEAARKGVALEGASLYVTTFPCPICAKSIAVSGIKKLYYHKGYSLLDAEDILRAFGVEIILVKEV